MCVRRISCCCAMPPPLPPPSPHPPRPKPPPPPSPSSPPPPPYSHLDDQLIAGATKSLELHPDTDTSTSTLRDSTKYTWLAVVGFACLMVFGKLLRKQLRFLTLYRTTQRRLGKHQKLAPAPIDDEIAYPDQADQPGRAAPQEEEEETPWKKRRPRRGRALEQEDEDGREGRAETIELAGAAADSAEDDDDIEESSNGRRPLRRERKKPLAQKGRRTSGTKGKGVDGHTRLCVELTDGSEYEISLDTSGADSVQELQSLVVEQWAGLGGSRQDSLMMQFMEREGDDFQKVTRSTTITTLRQAWALLLKAKCGTNQPAPSTCAASSMADHVRPGNRTRTVRAARRT